MGTDRNSKGKNRAEVREFVMSLSPGGQFTLPAAIRHQERARGSTRFKIRAIDPEAGIYQLERIPGLGAVLSKIGKDFEGFDLRGMLAEMRAEEQP